MSATLDGLALQSGSDAVVGTLVFLVFAIPLVFLVLSLAGQYRAHQKAGLPGWTGLVPFYGFYRRAKLTGNPGWYAALLVVPFANLFAGAKVNADFADLFGRGFVFAMGLGFLPFFFWPLLGFGEYTVR